MRLTRVVPQRYWYAPYKNIRHVKQCANESKLLGWLDLKTYISTIVQTGTYQQKGNLSVSLHYI